MNYKKFDDNLPKTTMISEDTSVINDGDNLETIQDTNENQIIKQDKEKVSMDIFISGVIPEHHDVGNALTKKFYQKPADHPVVWPAHSIKVTCDDCRGKIDTKIIKG